MSAERRARSTAIDGIDELTVILASGDLDPLDPLTIARSGSKGHNSAKVIRELRDKRSLHGW